MNLSDVFKTVDAISVRRVFGEPYEKDGLTVIPVASVAGGGGGGGAHDDKDQEGEGAGFGLGARPAGAYVVRAGEAKWQPAVDPNRLFTVVGAVLIAFLLTRPRVARAKAQATRGRHKG
jgi:uncharacterized spore protein YtfJ